MQEQENVTVALLGVPGNVPISAHEHSRIDSLESRLLEIGAPVDLPVSHAFAPGVYCRKIFMPAGTLLTSRIHNTEHHYVVIAGAVSVYIPGVGVERVEAPYFGITKPGTRRVLYIHEDCTWATYHPITPEEEVEPDTDKRLALIEERIIERRELTGGKTAFELYSALLDEAKGAGVMAPTVTSEETFDAS